MDRKAMIAAVFDRSAATYDSVGVDFFTPMGRDLVAYAAVRSGERVLDLGTGRGAVLFAARGAVGESGAVTGLDLAPGMVERARADAAARGLFNVVVAIGDAEQPKFPAGSFDVVLGGLLVFFLADPAAAVQRYREVLAPAGRLGFTTFGLQDPHFEAAMQALGRFVDAPMPDRGERQGPFSTPEGIHDLLDRAGYRDVRIEDRTYASQFRDGAHWLSWVWSHGGRIVLERIPEERRDAAADAALTALKPARVRDGSYVIRNDVRFTLGRT